jgi:hypothetical protein
LHYRQREPGRDDKASANQPDYRVLSQGMPPGTLPSGHRNPATAPLWQSHEMIARTVSAALCSLEQLFRFDIVEKIHAALMRIGGGLP